VGPISYIHIHSVWHSVGALHDDFCLNDFIFDSGSSSKQFPGKPHSQKNHKPIFTVLIQYYCHDVTSVLWFNSHKLLGCFSRNKAISWIHIGCQVISLCSRNKAKGLVGVSLFWALYHLTPQLLNTNLPETPSILFVQSKLFLQYGQAMVWLPFQKNAVYPPGIVVYHKEYTNWLWPIQYIFWNFQLGNIQVLAVSITLGGRNVSGPMTSHNTCVYWDKTPIQAACAQC